MKIKILVFAMLIAASTMAQNTISGIVKDSLGKPLEMANIIAINSTTKGLESYYITDAKGFYKLKLSSNTIFELKVSYLGFATETYFVTTTDDDKDIKKDFILKESSNKLDDVELTYEMPVTIKGDTLIYNAASFTNGTEKKLEDVLKKLPGVEITDEDEIEVDGKKVSKVMVDGKDFFDGDSKLAIKNIPADAISKVEVLKNYNEVSQMRGLGNDEDNIAINIRLKKGKKNFWFGEVSAGGGLDDRYLVHPKLFYYSPKKSVNILTDLNNIGELPFTFRDYFRFTGGFGNLNRRSGSSLRMSSGGLGLSMMQNNRAKEIETKFGAVNFSYSPNKALTFSGFAIYSDTRTEMQTNSVVTTQTNTFSNIENQQNLTDQKSQLGLLKFSTKYKPSLRFQLDYDALLKKSNLEEINLINSTSSMTGNNNIDVNKDSDPFSINQNLNMYYTLDDKNIFSVGMQYLYEKDNPFYNSLNTDQRFGIIRALPEDDNRFDLTQLKSLITNKFDATIDYYYILNDKSNINLTLGSSFITQDLSTHIFQTIGDDSIINFTDPTLNNDVEFNFSDVYLGLHYKVIVGAFTITPGLKMHTYSYKNTQLGSTLKQDPTKVLPDFYAKLSIKKSENITFNYNASTDFSDVNNLAEGVFLRNYNSLTSGNKNLTNTLYHNYTLRYFNFNMFSFTNIFGTINYSKKINTIKSNVELIGIDRISSSINSALPEDTFSTNLRYSKRYNKLKTDLSSRFSISNFNNIVNTNISESKTTTQDYKASVATNFKQGPNFTLGFQTTVNKYETTNTTNTFTTDRPFAKLEVPFLKSLFLVADYSYYNYRDKANTVKNTYSFLDADLYFEKEDSKWEFKLSVTNLLNTGSLNQDSFSEFITSTSQYFIQPRYWLFSVKYDL